MVNYENQHLCGGWGPPEEFSDELIEVSRVVAGLKPFGESCFIHQFDEGGNLQQRFADFVNNLPTDQFVCKLVTVPWTNKEQTRLSVTIRGATFGSLFDLVRLRYIVEIRFDCSLICIPIGSGRLSQIMNVSGIRQSY